MRRHLRLLLRGFDREVEVVAIDGREARRRRDVEALFRHFELGHRSRAVRIDRAALGEVHVAAELTLGEEPRAAGAVFGELRVVAVGHAAVARRRGRQQAL